ncbi:hypothetical protein LCGC14_2873250, partial [marine sediment metagenome]
MIIIGWYHLKHKCFALADSYVIGDLGVFTTIEDFLKWDQNFYDNKLGKGT